MCMCKNHELKYLAILVKKEKKKENPGFVQKFKLYYQTTSLCIVSDPKSLIEI